MGNLAYIKETKEFVNCDGEEWVVISVSEGPIGPAGAAGANGHANLILSSDEEAGTHCSSGGKKIQSGLDNGDEEGTANDGILQLGEIDITSYICHGEKGDIGSQGYSSLMLISTENAGSNCTYGGKKIQSGLDDGTAVSTAGDNVLQSGEVEVTSYICNGANGGVNGTDSLVQVTAESAGVNCTAGGKKIITGLDNGDGGGIANNGSLEAGEVDSTSYICNGVDGTNGTNGADGANGSNGSDGYSTLIITGSESPGANCTNGGTKIQAGLDNGDGGGTARNGLIEAGEVDTTTYLCNGSSGSNGANGSDGGSGVNSLIVITAETAGANCTKGGKKIETGLDNGDGGGTAGNNILESGEVDNTAYVCNGSSGGSGALAAYDADGNKIAYLIDWGTEATLLFGDGNWGMYSVSNGKLSASTPVYAVNTHSYDTLVGGLNSNQLSFTGSNCSGTAYFYVVSASPVILNSSNAIMPINNASPGGILAWYRFEGVPSWATPGGVSYYSTATWDSANEVLRCINQSGSIVFVTEGGVVEISDTTQGGVVPLSWATGGGVLDYPFGAMSFGQ